MTEPNSSSASFQIGIGAQYIKDFSFESPHAPHIFASIQTQPQMAMDINVMSRGLGEGNFESVLTLKVEAKFEDKTAFIAELTYAGVFTLQNMPEEQGRMFLLVEAPRLLFPFARAIISNAVREGGFPNIFIQPIDFLSMYNSQRGTIGSMETAGAA